MIYFLQLIFVIHFLAYYILTILNKHKIYPNFSYNNNKFVNKKVAYKK